MTRRALDFLTEWLSQNLDATTGAACLAAQLEVDALLVGITRSHLEDAAGPLEDFLAQAQKTLIEAWGN